MRWYSVGVETTSAPYTEDQADRLVAAIGEVPGLHGPALSFAEGGNGLGAQVSVEAETPGQAAEVAIAGLEHAAAAAGIALHDVGRTDVMTEEYLERWLSEPPEQLVGVSEIAAMLGVSKQRVGELRGQPGFPEPMAQLAAGPVWRLSTLHRFVRDWPRRPGRPRLISVARTDGGGWEVIGRDVRITAETRDAAITEAKRLARSAVSGRYLIKVEDRVKGRISRKSSVTRTKSTQRSKKSTN